MGTLYNYDIYALDERSLRYRYRSVKASSFVSAFYLMMTKNMNLAQQRVTIYCMRPKSGDLQLMGVYDGLSVMIQDGEKHERLLSLSNGESYELAEGGFRRVLA